MEAGILADDLTGACDTGAVFAARGFATVVLLPGAPAPPAHAEVLVLDAESRGVDPARARERAREAAARLAALGARRLYVKVDSTLRGPLGAALAGGLEGAGAARAVVAPALPAQRRAVVDGLLRVDGRPAADTPVARDPAFPPTGASLPAVLAVAGATPVVVVPLAAVRRGADAVRRGLARLEAVFACDAESDVDLAALAAAAEPVPALLAGSAGLAAALAARLAPGAGPPPAPGLRGPLLVVAGSAHPVTRAQVARLAGRGARVLAPAATSSGVPAAVAAELGAAARRELARAAPGTLLLTGGETAYSVCRALGASGLVLAGEAAPGIAVGALLDGPFAGLTVLTKAGGFGDPDALVRIHEALA